MTTSAMQATRVCLAGAAFLAATAQASAQTLSEFYFEGQAETRAVASIVIPLGGERQAPETKTRVDFAVTSIRHQANGNTPMRMNAETSLLDGVPPSPHAAWCL